MPIDSPRVAPPIARSLRAGHSELAALLPTDLTTLADLHAYSAVARERANTLDAVMDAWNLDVVRETDSVTVLRPHGIVPRARVVFVHGGGLVAGNRLDGVDVVARHAATGAFDVWTIEYPLVPTVDFDEIVARVLLVVRDAAATGLPVVLAGQSAGGGIAAAVALAARDAGLTLAGQMLVCPMLDAHDTVSAEQYASDPAWSRTSNRTAWRHATKRGALAPGDRTDLAGLAPAFLDVGSAEVFRDSVVSYTQSLWAAGVSAELHVFSGAFHASDGVVADAPVSVDAHRARGRWLERVLNDDV